MAYTVDYFLDKFEKIPEEHWCMGRFAFTNDKGESVHCVMGHCGELSYSPGGYSWGEEAQALNIHLQQQAVTINDGGTIYYDVRDENITADIFGNTPKKRILKALQLVKEGVSISGYAREYAALKPKQY